MKNFLLSIPVSVKIALVLLLLTALSLNYYYIPTAKFVNANLESTENSESTDFSHLIKCSRYGKKNLPIYCVKTDEPKIALSFDAAWGNEDTKEILDILDKHQIKATFFMTGGWVDNYPDDVKDIAGRGHELGNHSQNHKHMPQLNDSQKTEELLSVHKKVKELTGFDMCVFRPPYGDYDNALVTTAFKCGYYTIQWNVDSLDWKDYGVDSIIKTVTQHKDLKNGSIILMHNGAKFTADALDSLITTLKDKGYEFVTMSDLIYKDNFHMDITGMQISDENASSTQQ